MQDRILLWTTHHFEEIAGFLAGSGLTTIAASMIVTSIINLMLHILTVVISGILSSIAAHYTKKYLQNRNKNGKKE